MFSFSNFCKNFTVSKDAVRLSSFFIAAFSVFILLPDSAHATTTGLEKVMCNALSVIQGGVGRTIAAFAIIFLGISLFMGKVSWGLAISTALGIGAIFGAASIVDALGGGTGTCSATKGNIITS